MPEKKISNNETPSSEKVRVGVYTCHCGGNISHVVQCERVAKMLGKMPDVVIARTDPSFCSDSGQAVIEQDIKELGINRVVIGACAPSLHEQTFRNTVTRAGLNPYLYHHVGIREQDSWVHPNDPEGATDKAIRLMAAGLAKARLLTPLDPIRLKAEKHTLVIGGGVAGLRAALDIAHQGIRVTLVEKSPFLGGRMPQLESVFPTDEEARQLLNKLIQEVTAEESIKIITQAEVTGLSGYVGNYNISLTQHSRGVDGVTTEALMAACTQETPDEFNYNLTQRKVIYQPYPGCYPPTPAVDWEHYDGKPLQVNGKPFHLKDEPHNIELTVGAIVMATGFDPYEPRQGEYGYDQIPEVVTLPQLIRILSRIPKGEPLTWNGHAVRDLVLIHCVGSRELDGVNQPQADGQVNNYCSRVCCTASLHTAIDMRQRFPNLNIYELYQDIRTYGRGHEEIYRRAQNAMVRFVRYHGTELPEVLPAPAGDTHPVLVRVKDYLTRGKEIEMGVDMVVLAVGMMPRQIDDLVKMLKISRGTDRFLLEAHPKLRPVEMSVRGIVLAGTAQGPMNIQESLSAASAAAAKVAVLLGQGQVELPPFVARVDESKCNGTGACVEACREEGAIAMQTFKENGREIRRAVITPANCTGCGACVGACPNRAIDVQAWTLGQYEAMVDAITMEIPAILENVS
ncbi:MAG: CoB--CoM heterodisulfide reductase iron-sulfur subunit A family protein [Anaerolineaceae bacterium]|nr:CoB--CoM heterodisulfide reductase iron-sulfur subunit A family protein [Anaerolineaceae bacterium]MBN2677587.1 CoB--CoM heterodisulfide reductase iron-sulfur subunit A family protein [Anaerolineaceae bacterium]